ncbi:hypothetical protein ACF0H5_002598 [Mactra antiquata]
MSQQCKDVFIKVVLILVLFGCIVFTSVKKQVFYHVTDHVAVSDVQVIGNNDEADGKGGKKFVRSVQNKSVVYDPDILREQIVRLHSKLYENKSNSRCLHRDPKCLVIGVAKSGTKELVEFASLHPNIVSIHGVVKPDLFHTNQSVRMRSLNLMPGKKLCAYDDQIVLVKSDNFLAMPEMPEILHTFNPDLKLILIVREPVDRMKSGTSFRISQTKQHAMRFVFKPEEIPEMDSLFVNLTTYQVRSDAPGVNSSTYHIGLERYLKYFSIEQILVIESHEFKQNPVDVLQRLERFLKLKPVINSTYFAYVKEKGFYCINSDRIYCYGSDRGRTAVRELRPETIKTLKSYFKPHNIAFFKLIGRSFDW